MSDFNADKFDKEHLKRQYKRVEEMQKKFNEAINEASRIVSTAKIDVDKPFNIDDYPTIKKRMDALLDDVNEYIINTIEVGNQEEWEMANAKNNAMLNSLFHSVVLPKAITTQWKNPNESALKAFQNRKIEGMKLSHRVWNLTKQFKQELELALDLGIAEGKSADRLSRDVRRYLNEPNKLFRRVRDKHGNLRLSKKALAYHTGRGVYRSSYRNAMRLTITENNMAYRTADHLRWQKMDFVIGIEIKLSNNHTCKGVSGRFSDICDELVGLYPKEFKFVGWHPHCRCFAVAKLAKDNEMSDYLDKLANEQDVSNYQFTKVKELPTQFRSWYTNNEERIANAKSKPYFLRDNQKLIDKDQSNKKSK